MSTVITDARARGETLFPDEVHHEFVLMAEEALNTIRRKRSRQVVIDAFSSYCSSLSLHRIIT